MSLARVNIEDDDLVKIEEDGDKTHDGTGTGPSRAESVAAQTARAVNNDDRGASSLGTLTSNTLELTASQASHVRFPPGCCVMHMDLTLTLPAVAIGTIKSVAIDLGQSNTPVCCITPQGSAEKQNVHCGESNLLWGPTCPVWVRPSHLTAEQPNMAASTVEVVLGNVQVPDKVFCFVRDANDPSKMIHGIPQEAVVKHRPPENEAIAPAVSSDASVVNPEARDETNVVEASETPHQNLPFAQRCKLTRNKVEESSATLKDGLDALHAGNQLLAKTVRPCLSNMGIDIEDEALDELTANNSKAPPKRKGAEPNDDEDWRQATKKDFEKASEETPVSARFFDQKTVEWKDVEVVGIYKGWCEIAESEVTKKRFGELQIRKH